MESALILAGDIGGTKTNLALFDPSVPAAPRDFKSFSSTSAPGLEKIIADYLSGRNVRLRAASFGIAGPVIGQVCEATNLPWMVRAGALSAALGNIPVHLDNDLVSTALGIGVLPASDLLEIQAGAPDPSGNRAVIAAGTGLGEAVICNDGGRWIPFGTEGGHVDFAPRSELEIELLKWLMKKFGGHVSFERVLSGPGQVNIYDFLRERSGEPEPADLKAACASGELASAVTRAALEGRDEVASQALDLFVDIYGSTAGNLALKSLATGGLYLGGGIAPKIRARLTDGRFLRAFHDKGRFAALMKKIPVRVILNDKTALLGAAWRAGSLNS